MKRKINRIMSTMLLSAMLCGIAPTVTSADPTPGYNWQGKWIWTSNALPSATTLEGQWINLRKTFSLNTVPATAIARISVDSRYWMWINGELVVYEGQLKGGPTPDSWYYDVVDLAPYLQTGENTIAVLACYWGFDSASAKRTGKQAFLFDAEFPSGALAGGSTRLISDATWKAIKNPAYEVPPTRKNKRPDAVDTKFNASKALEGWQNPGFDDSAWEDAKVQSLTSTDPRNTLVERSIPQWKVYNIEKYDPAKWSVTDGSTAGTRIYSCYNITNMQGAPYLKVRSENGGETIKLSSDSTSHDGGESVLHWYVTKAGVQEWEAYNWMSAYRVDFTVPSTVEVLELGWRKSSYNTESTGSVVTDNEKMNQLYQEAYDTLLITMRDTYMDCPDRERTQWWGDAVLEMQQAAYAMDDNARLLYKKLLTQVIGWAKDHGGSLPTTPTNPTHSELPAQCLAGLQSLWQYYLYYGETDILETCYDGFMAYLKLWTMDEYGALNHRTGTSDWIDWGGNVDVPVLEYTWYYIAAESMRNVAQVLGKKQADIDFLQNRLNLMKENFESMFWDGQKNAYYSWVGNGKPDERAQAMAVYSGLADPAHYSAMLTVFKTTTNASPYMEKFVLEALYLMGYPEEAIARTLNRYDIMLTDDHPTLWEVWRRNQLSGEGGTNSRNHAWSGGPLSLMYMYNAGIIPTGAAFETFRIRPSLGSLNNISASTDTFKGIISVAATKNSLTVTVPAGSTSAEICVPRLSGKATTIKLGGTVVYANGAVAAVLPAGVSYSGEDTGYVNFTVVPGTYAFTMAEDTADSAGTHTVIVTAAGNGTVTVNGQAVQGSYTYTGSGNVTVAATPAAGSRVAYIAGAASETVYSKTAIERTYTPNRNMTLHIVFDEPAADKPVLKIVDASRDPKTSASIKGMTYAFHIFVNGKEVYIGSYFRDGMFPLPYLVAANKGETINLSVKPVDRANYEIFLNGKSQENLKLTMNADTEIQITVKERAGVTKIPVSGVTSNNTIGSSSIWKPAFLIDGKRLCDPNAYGYSSNGFSSQSPATPVTIKLDLGGSKTFNQISLFPRTGFESITGGARCFPVDFTIEVSPNDSSYVTVVTVKDNPDPHIQQQVYNFDAIEARYVKITVTKVGSYDFQNALSTYYRVQLAEVEVAYSDPEAIIPAPSDDPEEDTTAAPEEPTTEPSTTQTPEGTTTNEGGKKKRGCASVVSGGMATVLLALSAVFFPRKKKKKSDKDSQ